MSIKNKISWVLILLLFLGFFLRLGGIRYGLPYLSHPDESRVILDTLSMGHRLSLIPARPDYSLLYRYLLLFLYGCYFLIGKLFRFFKDVGDFAFQFMVNPTAIYIITRMVSVILSTFSAIVAYFLAKKFFDQTVAFVSFIFVLFEYQLIQHGQWGIYHAALCFMSLLAFYFMFQAVLEPGVKSFALMGIFTGLAVSTQNHGIFLVPSLFVTAVLHFIKNRETLKTREFLKLWLVLFLCLGLASFLGNFYWIFIFKKVTAKYAELLGVTRIGFASQAPYPNNVFSMTLWLLKEIIRQDYLLGAILVLGITYSIYRHTQLDIIFLVYVMVNMWIFSGWGFRLLHDLLAVLPILCIFGARVLVEWLKKLKLKEVFINTLACFIVLPFIYESVIIDIKKNHPDTRQLARAWIEDNIPASEKIAIDWHVFSIPLDNEIPLYFRNPVVRKYYDEKIPQAIKKKYLDYLKDRKVYQIIEAMSPLEEPRWPQDMPEEAREEAAKQAFYVDIYSKFHFRSPAGLKEEGAKYLIISSYIYGYFLLNNDPNKKFLFNPYVKDRIDLNFSQADHYIKDHRYGLLYFISRDARNFYLPLLDNTSKDAVLIKEFRPDTGHLGPIIKIYQLRE